MLLDCNNHKIVRTKAKPIGGYANRCNGLEKEAGAAVIQHRRSANLRSCSQWPALSPPRAQINSP